LIDSEQITAYEYVSQLSLPRIQEFILHVSSPALLSNQHSSSKGVAYW